MSTKVVRKALAICITLFCALTAACGEGEFAVEVTVRLNGVPIPATLLFDARGYTDAAGVTLESSMQETLNGSSFFAVPDESNRILIVGTPDTELIVASATAYDGTGAVIGGGGEDIPRVDGLARVFLDLSPGAGPDGGSDSGTDSLVVDSGPDLGVDAGSDSATDAGPPPVSACNPVIPTYIVTVVDDELDDPSATGTADVGGAGDLSLREALTIADNTTGLVAIRFDPAVFPPGSGTVIDVGSGTAGTGPLPNIVDDICVDGSGADVVLSGASVVGLHDGLHISGVGNTISAITVVSFSDDGIDIEGNGNTIVNCSIGVVGTTVLGNGSRGIELSDFSGNSIGPGNIVGGNVDDGINIQGSATTVIGNWVGVTPAGAPVPNLDDGIELGSGASGNTVGLMGMGNVVGFNAEDGIVLRDSGTATNAVAYNFVGTSASMDDFGNGGHGILVHLEASFNIIGPSNVIAFNGSSGIRVDGDDGGGTTFQSLANLLTQNEIFSNLGLAISLVNGGNNAMMPPLISTNVGMSVDGVAPMGAFVELFGSNGVNDARCYLGSGAADPSGLFTVALTGANCGTTFVATATDGSGNTSELSGPGP